jgi:hypothetical protein
MHIATSTQAAIDLARELLVRKRDHFSAWERDNLAYRVGESLGTAEVFLVDSSAKASALLDVGILALNVCNDGVPQNIATRPRARIISDHDILSRQWALALARQISSSSGNLITIVDPFKGEALPWEDGKTVLNLMGELGPADALRRLRSASSRIWPLQKDQEPKSDPSPEILRLNLLPIALAESDQRNDSERFVWHHTLPRGGVCSLIGRAKDGKTTLAENLAVAIQNGDDFLGRSTTKGRVLYLAFEGNGYELKRQLLVLGAAGDGVLVHADLKPRDIEEALKWVQEGIVTTDPHLVIIDSLGKILEGAVENINQQYLQISGAIDRFIEIAKETGVTILVTHHANAQGGALGSEAIFGSVDCELRLHRGKGKQRTLSSEPRVGIAFESLPLSFDKETRRICSASAVKGSMVEEIRSEVIKLLAKGDILKSRVKEKLRGHSNGDIGKALKQFIADGLLIQTGKGGKGDPYVLSLSKEMPGNAEGENAVLDTQHFSIPIFGVSEGIPAKNRNSVNAEKYTVIGG